MAQYARLWLNKPFTLLDPPAHRWLLILVTGLFTVLFINLYVPFNMVRWYRESDVPLVLILSSFAFVGVGVLIITQFPLRWAAGLRTFSRLTFAAWMVGELLLLSLLMMLIYGDAGESPPEMMQEWIFAFRNTSLVVLIPYASTLWYLHYRKRMHEVSRPVAHPVPHRVHVRDERGILRLAMQSDMVLFFQSSENYVTVHYLEHGSVRKELVRTTLKRLEKELDASRFVRCHRSYIVNISKFRAFNRGLKHTHLEVEEMRGTRIPVSRNFRRPVLRLLGSGNLQPLPPFDSIDP